MLTSNAVNRGFEPWSSHPQNYKIGICHFSTKEALLRSKSKDWLAQNEDYVSCLLTHC